MINGIVASAIIETGGVGLFDDAVADFDFVNGTYLINGSTVAIGDNIDKPGNVIPSSGLSVDWDVPGDVVTPLGALFAALCTAEFTLMVEAYLHADTEATTLNLISARLASDPFDFHWLMNASDTIASFDSDNVNGISGQRFISISSSITLPAIRRSVMTRTVAKLVGSTNGSPIQSDTSGGWATADAMDTVMIGAQVGDTDPTFKGYFRRIAVLPVKDDADMPLLSTVS